MKKFLRILSIALLISNSCSLLQAGGGGEPSSSTSSFVHPGKDAFSSLYEKTVHKAELLSPELLEAFYEVAPEEIKKIVFVLQNRELAMESEIPSSLLLYGQQGVSRSMLAQVLAQKSDPTMDCWVVHARYILDSYKKGLDERVNEGFSLFDNIDNSKQCVVLIDEADALSYGCNNDSNRAIGKTLGVILEKVYSKKNVLLVLTAHKEDHVPAILKQNIETAPLKIDLPNETQRRATIEYWFRILQNIDFQCEYTSYFARLLNNFKGTSNPNDLKDENNKNYKNMLAKKTAEFSYGDILELFIKTIDSANKRALEKNESIVTILAQDFDRALTPIQTKNTESKPGTMKKVDDFFEEHPRVANVAAAAAAAAATAAAAAAVEIGAEAIKCKIHNYFNPPEKEKVTLSDAQIRTLFIDSLNRSDDQNSFTVKKETDCFSEVLKPSSSKRTDEVSDFFARVHERVDSMKLEDEDGYGSN